MIIAEAERLGLLNVRVQHTAGFPHLVADFNGKPISVPLFGLSCAGAAAPPRQ
jgi:hypothetical protein